MLNNSHKLSLFLGLWFFFFVLHSPVSAVKMESQRYLIQSEDIEEVQIENKSKDDHSLLTGEAQRKFNQNGYTVSSNNSDIFTFSLEENNVTFKSNSSGNTKLASNKVTLTSINGHQLNIIQKNSLRSLSGDTVQQTPCDQTCSNNHASIWLNNTRYGFGYSVKGDFVTEDFKSLDYFRVFSDESKKQAPAIILKNSGVKSISKAQLLLKFIPTEKNNQIYSTIINVQGFPAY